MKLKTKLIVAFVTLIILPVGLIVLAVYGFGSYQIKVIEKTYELSGTTYESLLNSVQMMNRLAEQSYHKLKDIAQEDPEKLEDATYLEKVNQKLERKSSYLIVRRGENISYIGADSTKTQKVIEHLPQYQGEEGASENGVYLGGESRALVKQIDFQYPDKEKGSIFIVTDAASMVPEVKAFLVDIVFAVIAILFLTASVFILWIYRSVVSPIRRMQAAAANIKEGNLDFHLEAEADDELGELCHSMEDMRLKLKDTMEEKLVYDKESKELISNISHDLKTPITAIKGYVEGIMDGVADTPEKIDKYIRTIYNKANEMDALINELTLYSKIDMNRIPYNFATIPVNAYFEDCAEDLSLELEAKGVDFSYSNFVEGDIRIIADAEQLKRVINNIVNNSLKYMDKEKAKIQLRVKDVGDFIQVELEDNGKGIANKDLPNIFERFYRADASRNSSKGGSGIGLSIVKKIIEEHGGKIWATSKEGTGTIMYFVIRKYQEVPVHE